MRLGMKRMTLSVLAALAATLTMSAVLYADPFRVKPKDDCGAAKLHQEKHPNPGRHVGWDHQYWKASCKDASPGPDGRPADGGSDRDPADEEGGGSGVIHVPPLKVTPEPGTLALLATGVAGAALARRRRRQNRP